MRHFLLITLLILASCAVPQQPHANQTRCAWPEIASDSGCCRDLNENGICDTKDFASEIEAEKQQEYEAAAQKARETAAQSGKLRRTIVNDLYDAAKAVTSYRFRYQGDDVIVTPEGVVRKLPHDRSIGIHEVDGKKYDVVINTIMLDLFNKQATAQCVPREEFTRTQTPSPCDNYLGIDFDVIFWEYHLRLPTEWLENFLNRKPYEALPGGDIGKLKTTIYRFADLQDATRKTYLWVDDQTKMPVRIEVWEGDKLRQHEEYVDLYAI